jgi:hypothetical protein
MTDLKRLRMPFAVKAVVKRGSALKPIAAELSGVQPREALAATSCQCRPPGPVLP